MKTPHVKNKTRRVVLVDARYTEEFGPAAGTLLSQIVYWFKPGASGKTKLRVRREGRLWLAKRREDWAAECGLSPRQYDTAVSKLLASEIVRKKVWRFAGSPTVHLCLDQERLIDLFDHTEITDVCDPINHAVTSYTETTTDTTTESEALAAAPQGLKKSEMEESKEAVEEAGAGATKEEAGAKEKFATQNLPSAPHKFVDERTADDWMAVAQKILDLHRGKAMPPKEVRLTANALSMAWKMCVHEMFGVPARNMTQKEVGQLKQLSQKVREHAPAVLRYVISNWGEFCFEAKCCAGLSSSPERPHAGFLLAHHDVAMNLMIKPVQSIAKTIAKKLPSSSKVETSMPSKPKPITLEEIDALLAGTL